MRGFRIVITALVCAATASISGGVGAQDVADRGQDGATIEGVGTMVRYQLASGEEHLRAGDTFLVRGRWRAAFFVLDPAGSPQRASAGGGSYEVSGANLTFHDGLLVPNRVASSWTPIGLQCIPAGQSHRLHSRLTSLEPTPTLSAFTPDRGLSRRSGNGIHRSALPVPAASRALFSEARARSGSSSR